MIDPCLPIGSAGSSPVEGYLGLLLHDQPEPAESLLEILKKRGKLVLVGFPRLVLNPTDLVAHELSITGSFLGNRATMREMLLFASEHEIVPKIEPMPMAQVNEAIRKVKEKKVRYRIVLVNTK